MTTILTLTAIILSAIVVMLELIPHVLVAGMFLTLAISFGACIVGGFTYCKELYTKA